MSYSISEKSGIKTFTVNCDEPKCKAHFDSAKGKGDAWQTVKAQGWFSDSASNHRCVDHKPARATRKVAVKANPSKSAVAQTKAEKVAGKGKGKTETATVTKNGTKVSVGNRVPAKDQTATFSGGQSIGRKARASK
jgi:hypothetical protein